MARKLIWVPIVHTQADLGSMSEAFRQAYIRRAGRGRWVDHVRAVERTWSNISDEMDRLQLDWSVVRLYQDGLPICGQEEQIVREVAAAGSRNHQLLLELMQRGAKLEGTESPEYLLEEYRLLHCPVEASRPGRPVRATARQDQLRQEILTRRDRFIAERIASTLEDGWTGLLFLGMLHSVDGFLPGDIETMRLDRISTLPSRGAGGRTQGQEDTVRPS